MSIFSAVVSSKLRMAARIAATVLVAMLALAPAAESQPACATACAPSATGGGMTCTVTASFPTMCNMGTVVATVASGTVSAMCLPGTSNDYMAMASHAPGSGPNMGTAANCNFMFNWSCTAPPATATVTCTASTADMPALPVELMDFSIEDEDEETEPEDGEPGR